MKSCWISNRKYKGIRMNTMLDDIPYRKHQEIIHALNVTTYYRYKYVQVYINVYIVKCYKRNDIQMGSHGICGQ